MKEDENMYCEICKKVVYKTYEDGEGDGEFIEGYIALWNDETEIGIVSVAHNYSWLLSDFGIKIPDKGMGFCCEEHLKEWFKRIIKPVKG